MKKIIALLLLAGWCGAQMLPANCIKQTWRIDGFVGTVMKYTPAFVVTDYENIAVTIRVNDPSATGFALDTVKFYAFWQRGYIVYNSSGRDDTIWRSPSLLIDTIYVNAGNYPDTASTIAEPDSDVVKMLDTSSVTGFICYAKNICPKWSPVARIGVKGLTGNNANTALSLVLGTEQRKWAVVNGPVGKQPDPGY
jgi:hypothetical protein